jgi:hypothetical protein
MAKQSSCAPVGAHKKSSICGWPDEHFSGALAHAAGLLRRHSRSKNGVASLAYASQ